MTSILPFDELNRVSDQIRVRLMESAAQAVRSEEVKEDVLDMLLDFFLLSYAMGNRATNENLSADWIPQAEDALRTINKKIAGKTWEDRVNEYFDRAKRGEIPVSPGQREEAKAQEGIPSPQAGKEQGASSGKESSISGFDQMNLTDAIIRILETEMHRDANEAALETARHAGAKTKTWQTMMDDKVRETHDYLLGVTVGIEDDFITFDGDKAQAPGLFELPENNINCRCELEFA